MAVDRGKKKKMQEKTSGFGKGRLLRSLNQRIKRGVKAVGLKINQE